MAITFNGEKPFELTKFLLKGVLGSNGRPSIAKLSTTDEKLNLIVRYGSDGREENYDMIEMPEISDVSLDFIEKFAGSLETPTEDYSKLFFEFGRALALVTTYNLLKATRFVDASKAYAIFNVDTLDARMSNAYNHLLNTAEIVKNKWVSFLDSVTIKDKVASQFHVEPSAFVALVESLGTLHSDTEFDAHIGDILSIVYGITYFLSLSAALFGISNKVYSAGSIFGIDGVDESRVSSVLSAMDHSTLTDETKLRFKTLCYTFYRLNRFYRVYSGISFDDQIVTVVSGIGYVVSKDKGEMEKIEELFSDITVDQGNFLEFTARHDIIYNFSTAKDRSIKNDSADLFGIAGRFIAKVIVPPSNPTDGQVRERDSLQDIYVPPMLKYVTKNVAIDSYHSASNDALLKLYEKARALLVTNVDTTPFSLEVVDTASFYHVVLLAATMRYFRYNKKLFGKFSDEQKALIISILHMTDSWICIAYNYWFIEGRFTSIAPRPHYTDGMSRSDLDDAKREVNGILSQYNTMIEYLVNSDWELELSDAKRKELKFTVLRRFIENMMASSWGGEPKILEYRAFETPDQYLAAVRNGTCPVAYGYIFAPDRAFANPADLQSAWRKHGVHHKFSDFISDIAHVYLDDEAQHSVKPSALQYALIAALSAEEDASLSDIEYYVATYVPYLYALVANYHDTMTKSVIEFKKPDDSTLLYNYETLFNQTVINPMRNAIARSHV